MSATPIQSSQSRLDLFRIEAEDKVALNGLLWEPQKAGDSAVVMVPGGTTGAALYPAHDYSPLANALTDRGYAFLLGNMRASYNNPFAEYSDAVKDIAALVAYAKSKGYARIAILGISLGGPRMAQYVAERNDPAVKAVGIHRVDSITVSGVSSSERRSGQAAPGGYARARTRIGRSRQGAGTRRVRELVSRRRVNHGNSEGADQLLRSAARSERT